MKHDLWVAFGTLRRYSWLLAIVAVCMPPSLFGLAELEVGGNAVVRTVQTEYDFDLRARIDIFSFSEMHMSEAGYLRYLTFSARGLLSEQFWFSPVGISYGFGGHAFTLPVNVIEIGIWPKTMNFRNWIPEMDLAWKFGVFSVAASVDWDHATKDTNFGLFVGLTATPEFSAVDLLRWLVETGTHEDSDSGPT